MTGTPRRPWTPERDKELRELVFSASSAETIAKVLNRTTFAVRRRASTLRLPLRKIGRRRSSVRAGVDLQTFECAICNHELKTLAAYEDPMKSRGLGRWLQGDLHPPK
jgi:hypothetical protein